MDDGRCDEHVPGHGEEFRRFYGPAFVAAAGPPRPGYTLRESWGWSVVVASSATPDSGWDTVLRRLSAEEEAVLDVMRA